MRFPPPKVIAVDVDGTLMRNGKLNERVVAWCRKKHSEGFTLNLWSARGKAFAQRAAKLCGLEDVFSDITSKPGFILDDMGWRWTRYTMVVRKLE